MISGPSRYLDNFSIHRIYTGLSPHSNVKYLIPQPYSSSGDARSRPIMETPVMYWVFLLSFFAVLVWPFVIVLAPLEGLRAPPLAPPLAPALAPPLAPALAPSSTISPIASRKN